MTEPSQPSQPSYPSLARLGARVRRRLGRIPVMLQSEWSDCGAACLTMVMAYYGKHVERDEVRREVGAGRDGLDARLLLAGAERFGLRGRGLEVDLDDLPHLPRGAILHWEFNHFVIFERLVGDRVEIVDPACGRELLSRKRFSQRFTGVALVLEPGESFEPGGQPERSRLRVYLDHVLEQRKLLGRVLVSSVLLRLLGLTLPILTALLVDHVVPRSDLHLLLVVAVGLVGVVLFQVLSSLIRAYMLLQLRTNLDTRLTLGFLEHLVSLPYDFFQRRSTGDLMMRVASNSSIRELLTSNTLSALLDGSLVLAYLAVILWVSPPLGALTLALGVGQLLVFALSYRRVADLMREQLEAQAQAQNYLVQVLGGIETLKVGGAEGRAVERWSNFFVDELNVSLDSGRLQAGVDAAMIGLNSASPLLILGFGAVLVIHGQLSLGAMLALSALALGFLQPLSSLVKSALALQRLSGYAERIHDVMATKVEQDRREVGPAPRLSGRVSLRGVSFRYDPESPLVLDDVSLEIEPGDCVALVGRSGSGKSTLASLLLGLYDPSEGSIRYDGHELARLDLRGLRRQLGYVPQDPYIFGQSLRENIAMAEPGVSLEAVELAAQRAAIHDDIMAMRMGYSTIISDGGGSLSGGQRQRVALARALINDPTILILDEATSALDTQTERRVMAELERMSCVRVIIAHRLSTITFADKIVVLDGGRLVDVGRHAELLTRCGVYRELVAAGTEGEGDDDSSRLRAMGGQRV